MTLLALTANWELPDARFRVTPGVVEVRTAWRADQWYPPVVPPRPAKLKVGFRTGWLNVTVRVPRPVQVPFAAQVPVFTRKVTPESLVTMLDGEYMPSAHSLAPSVLTPVTSVRPLEVTVAVRPEGNEMVLVSFSGLDQVPVGTS